MLFRFIPRKLFLFGCLILLAAIAARLLRPARPALAASPARHLAVRAARLLDVRSGKVIAHPVVLIEGDKISAVGPDLLVPAGATVLNLGDVTLLPGLIDAHTHITYHFDETGHFGSGPAPTEETATNWARDNARRTLLAGFTTIRNLGAPGGVDVGLRDAVNRGEAVGPRLLVSGEPLLPGDIAPGTDAERSNAIRAYVRARIKEGVDVIKIFEGQGANGAPEWSADDIKVAVEEAARGGRKVAVHAHEAAEIKAAVEGGCASIEHGSFLDDTDIQLMVAHHTRLVPTLYLPTHYLEHKAQFAFDDDTWAFFEKLRAHNLDNARRAHQAGVVIVSGSDAVAGVHGNNAKELEWLVKAGLSPVQAIRAATLEAAALLGWEGRVGDIKAGCFADLIAVAGDPAHDITRLQHVAWVMKDGQMVKNGP